MNYVKFLIRNLWNQFLDSGFHHGILAIWLMMGGVHTYLYTIVALTVIDVITGVWKSLRQGEPFTSRKLRKGLLEKVGLYLLLLVSVFILDKLLMGVIGHSTGYFAFIITFLISCYELTSIAENLSVLMPQIPFLRGLVRIFKKMGSSTIDKVEKNVDTVIDTVTEIKTVPDPVKGGEGVVSPESTEGQ